MRGRGAAVAPRQLLAWALGTFFVLLFFGCSDVQEQEGLRPSQTLTPPPAPVTAEDPDAIAAEVRDSIHAELDCVDCHVPASGDPRAPLDYNPGDEIATARCDHCHEQEQKNWQISVHGVNHVKGNGKAAKCVHCHGAHDIQPSTDPRSLVYQRRLPVTCGQCHRNPEVSRALGIANPENAGLYQESVHGKALLTAGLLSAPSCADCHGHQHLIFKKEDKRSTINPANVPDTCGHCHEGPEEDYKKSIHAQAFAEGKKDAPICTTCHQSHAVVKPTGGFRLASDAICGKCHEDRLQGYFATYHGRAHNLGSGQVAACYDCHGAHDIRPKSDPASKVSDQNRLQTCRSCHASAPKSFASYYAHGTHTDREHYPLLYWAFVIMTSLIVGTFAVWGVHTLLWMLRTMLVYLKSPRAFREEKKKVRTEVKGKVYVRFQPIDRFTHLLVIVSFMILVGTGMPLKFHETAWARAIIDFLGGPGVAATLHRFGAILSFLYLFIHVSTLVSRVRAAAPLYRDEKGRFRIRKLLGFVFGPDSPLPNLQDIMDVQQHVAWFLGRGKRPAFDRFTYWEKFDYFAELWGSAFIGFSGLVMWLPGVFAHVFPGWIVNLAQVVHSQEALLAAGFILTFHFFNSHFRLEKFPMDTVIFSGRITEEELKHERARQYERLQAEGRLGEIQIEDEWESWKWLFQTFGTLAVFIGLGLVIGIFYAILRYGLQ